MRVSRLVITGAMSALLLLPGGVVAQSPAGDPFGVTLNMKAYAKTRTAGLTVKAVNVPTGKTVKGFFLSTDENRNPGPAATGWKVAPSTFLLPDADGAHTVYAWAKHSGSPQVVTATPASDTIFLDRVAPEVDTFTGPNGVTVTSRVVTVSMVAFDPGAGDDPATGSGIVRYAVKMGTTPPDPGAKAWKLSPPTSFTLSTGNGPKTYSAFVRDAAGNVSAASSKTVTLTQAAPTVTLSIADYTKTQIVPITLTATDPAAAGGLRFIVKENPTTPLATATGWQIKPSTFTLSSGQGTKTVHAWVKDANGTVSTVSSDSVTWDGTAPTASFAITPASSTSRTVAVVASGTDAVSGVTHWALVNGTGTPGGTAWKAFPANGFPTSHLLPLGNGPKTVSFYVRDGAGNVSAAASDSVALNIAAPTLTLTLPEFTKAYQTSVGVSTTDPGGTGIHRFFLSTSDTTPAASDPGWFAAVTTFTFSGLDGTKTLFGWVKDNNGTVSAVSSDSTLLDRTAPDVTLTVTGDEGPTPSLSISAVETGSGSTHFAVVVGNSPQAPIFPNAAWKSTAGGATAAVSLVAGPQLVTAFVRDAAGNVSAVDGDSSKTVTVVP